MMFFATRISSRGTIGSDETAGLPLLRCRRGASRGGQCAPAGNAAGGAALRNPTRQSAGSAGFHRCLSQGDGTAAARPLQSDAQERLDARLAAAYCGHARGDPHIPRAGRARAGKVLAREPPGPGGLAGAQFESRDLRELAACAAGCAHGRHSNRHRRLSAALLDGAPGTALHLRNGQGGGAGARHGPRRGSHSFASRE